MLDPAEGSSGDDAGGGRRLEDLLELAEILASYSRFDDRMSALCAWGARLIDCDRVSIFRREGRHLVGAFNFGNPPDVAARFDGFRVSLNDPLVARAFSTGTQVTVNDTVADPLFNSETARTARIRAMVLAPLWGSDQRPGGFVTAEYNERPRAFTALQSRMLAGVAKLAQSIINADALRVAHSNALMASESLLDRLHDLEHSESLGQLAGGVAHDFNNLLAVIIGNTELLRENATAGDMPLLAEVMRASAHAADLTAQLLRYARNREPIPSVFDFATVIEELRPLLDRSVGELVSLDSYVIPGCHVTMERPQAEQILLNLALNARDAMPAGGTLRLSCRPEYVGDDDSRRYDVQPGRYVHLQVSDTGHGIPEPLLPKLFTPFVTSHHDDRHFGLGLTTVFRIVTGAGGAITAGNGATGAVFDVLFPIAEPADVSGSHPDTQTGVVPTGTERLLIVDDNAPLLAVLERQLARLGYDVTVAHSGEEAWLSCRGGMTFDLVVSDVLMPGLSGPDLARRWEEMTPDQPFLFMSAYKGSPVIDDRLLNRSVLLEKPFTYGRLARAIRSVLDAPASTRSP